MQRIHDWRLECGSTSGIRSAIDVERSKTSTKKKEKLKRLKFNQKFVMSVNPTHFH